MIRLFALSSFGFFYFPVSFSDSIGACRWRFYSLKGKLCLKMINTTVNAIKAILFRWLFTNTYILIKSYLILNHASILISDYNTRFLLNESVMDLHYILQTLTNISYYRNFQNHSRLYEDFSFRAKNSRCDVTCGLPDWEKSFNIAVYIVDTQCLWLIHPKLLLQT